MAPDGRKLLASVDAMVEGVHFDLAFITPFQLGYKLVAVNVSDVYAMGGSPRYLFLSLALPKKTTTKFIDSFFHGLEIGLKEHGARLAGGDLSASLTGITASATVLGYAANPVLRSGAKVGHGIYVTGTLGDSACGLHLLKLIGKRVDTQKGRQRPYAWKLMGPLIKSHLLPSPRLPGKAAIMHASAMMDLSDGLSLDLYRLIGMSGKGAEIYEDALPISAEMREMAGRLNLDPVKLALGGGEDYVILFTAPVNAMARRRGIYKIGRIVRDGYVIKRLDGTVQTIKPMAPRLHPQQPLDNLTCCLWFA